MKYLFLNLPGEIKDLLEEIREANKNELQTQTNKSIVIDAIKAYHKKVVRNAKV